MDVNYYKIAGQAKTLSMDKCRAWDYLIQQTGLRPGIDAKEFYEIFQNALPVPVNPEKPTDFIPTHIDTLCTVRQMGVKITFDGDLYNLLWDTGHTGTHPASMSPFEMFPGRFVEVCNGRD